MSLHKTQALSKGRRYLSRYHIRGTHTGPGLGLGAPTGKPFTAGGMAMHKFGKAGSGKEKMLVKEWNYSDDLGLVCQLGLFCPSTTSSAPTGSRAMGQPSQSANVVTTVHGHGTTAGQL